MKRILTLVLCLFFFSSMNAQFNTSVQLGSGQFGTQYGYKMGKFSPYSGLSLSNTINNLERIYGIDSTDNKNSHNNIGILLGIKYAVYEGEKITAWVDLGMNKLFSFEKYFNDGELQENDHKTIYWGGGLAFQVEYFINDNISLGSSFKVGLSYSEGLYEDVERDRYTLEKTFQNHTSSFLVMNIYF